MTWIPLASFAVLVMVCAVVWRMSPKRPPSVRPAVLKGEYFGWIKLAHVLTVVCGAAVGMVYGLLLVAIRRRVGPAAGLDQVVYAPAERVLFVPAMVVGMLSSDFLVRRILIRLLGGARYRELEEFLRYRWGREWRYAGRVFRVAVIAAAVVGSALLIDNYVRVTPRGIGVSPFLTFGERWYPYDQVEGVYLVDIATDERAGYYPHHEIRFKDGTTWGPTDTWDERPEDLGVMGAIAGRANLPIRHIERLSQLK